MIQKLKSLSFREKIQYIWDYYKLRIVIIFIILVLLIIFATNRGSNVEISLYCLIFNDANNTELAEHIVSTYSEYIQSDPNSISIDNGYVFSLVDEEGINWPDQASSIEYLRAQASGEADVIITDYQCMLWAKYVNFLTPLDEILPNDLYQQLEPYFVYAVFQDDSDEQTDGLVYGLDISDTEIYKGYSLNYEDAIVCFPNVSENPDSAISFLKYLYGISQES